MREDISFGMLGAYFAFAAIKMARGDTFAVALSVFSQSVVVMRPSRIMSLARP